MCRCELSSDWFRAILESDTWAGQVALDERISDEFRIAVI